MADVIRKATNRFTKGLVMDFSPENTKNELLTHALNATLLTFNGNELSLQNDMGNARVETAYLPDGYMPVGTCEYGGIIYIVSYNPLEDKSQIGCFPSPERNISSDELGIADKSINKDYFQKFTDGVPDTSGTILHNTQYVLLKNDSLNPGDKFIVCADKSIYNEKIADMFVAKDKNQDSVQESDYEPIINPVIALNVVSIEDSGKIVYLNSDIRHYEVANSYQINQNSHTDTYKYHILGKMLPGTSQLAKDDLDSYRNVLSSGYSVFKSKTSGKLAILAELIMVDSYSVTHSVVPRKSETGEIIEGTFDIVIHTDITPTISNDNYYLVPKLKYYYLENSQGYIQVADSIKVNSNIPLFEIKDNYNTGKYNTTFFRNKLQDIYEKVPGEDLNLDVTLKSSGQFNFPKPRTYNGRMILYDGEVTGSVNESIYTKFTENKYHRISYSQIKDNLEYYTDELLAKFYYYNAAGESYQEYTESEINEEYTYYIEAPNHQYYNARRDIVYKEKELYKLVTVPQAAEDKQIKDKTIEKYQYQEIISFREATDSEIETSVEKLYYKDTTDGTYIQLIGTPDPNQTYYIRESEENLVPIGKEINKEEIKGAIYYYPSNKTYEVASEDDKNKYYDFNTYPLTDIDPYGSPVTLYWRQENWEYQLATQYQIDNYKSLGVILYYNTNYILVPEIHLYNKPNQLFIVVPMDTFVSSNYFVPNVNYNRIHGKDKPKGVDEPENGYPKDDEIFLYTVADFIPDNDETGNSYLKYSDLKLANIKIPKVVSSNGLDLPFKYDYTIVPCMNYGKLQHLAISNTVDFSKLHAFNKSDFTTWKYRIDDNQLRLTFGAEVHDTYETNKVDGLVLEFYDCWGFAGSIEITDKKSYSGIFTKVIPLNALQGISNKKIMDNSYTTEYKRNINIMKNNNPNLNGEFIFDGKETKFLGSSQGWNIDKKFNDCGTLYSNLVYGVRTYLRRTTENGKEFIPKKEFFLYTLPIYNDFYYTLNDFSNLKNPELDLMLTYKLQDNSSRVDYNQEGIIGGYNTTDRANVSNYLNGFYNTSNSSSFNLTKYYKYKGTSDLYLEIGLKKEYEDLNISYDPSINEYFSCELLLLSDDDKDKTFTVNSGIDGLSETSQILNYNNGEAIIPTSVNFLKFAEPTNQNIPSVKQVSHTSFKNANFINYVGNTPIKIDYEFVVGYKATISKIKSTQVQATTICALCHMKPNGEYNYEDFGIYEQNNSTDEYSNIDYLSGVMFYNEGTATKEIFGLCKQIKTSGVNMLDECQSFTQVETDAQEIKTAGKLNSGDPLKQLVSNIGKLTFCQPHAHGLSEVNGVNIHEGQDTLNYGIPSEAGGGSKLDDMDSAEDTWGIAPRNFLFTHPKYNMCLNTKNMINYHSEFLSTLDYNTITSTIWLFNCGNNDSDERDKWYGPTTLREYKGLTGSEIAIFNKKMVETMKNIYAYNPDYDSLTVNVGDISLQQYNPSFTSNLINTESNIDFKEKTFNDFIYLGPINYSNYLLQLKQYSQDIQGKTIKISENDKILPQLQFSPGFDYCGTSENYYLISNLTYNTPVPQELEQELEFSSQDNIVIKHSNGENTFMKGYPNKKTLYGYNKDYDKMIQLDVSNYTIDSNGVLTVKNDGAREELPIKLEINTPEINKEFQSGNYAFDYTFTNLKGEQVTLNLVSSLYKSLEFVKNGDVDFICGLEKSVNAYEKSGTITLTPIIRVTNSNNKQDFSYSVKINNIKLSYTSQLIRDDLSLYGGSISLNNQTYETLSDLIYPGYKQITLVSNSGSTINTNNQQYWVSNDGIMNTISLKTDNSYVYQQSDNIIEVNDYGNLVLKYEYQLPPNNPGSNNNYSGNDVILLFKFQIKEIDFTVIQTSKLESDPSQFIKTTKTTSYWEFSENKYKVKYDYKNSCLRGSSITINDLVYEPNKDGHRLFMRNNCCVYNKNLRGKLYYRLLDIEEGRHQWYYNETKNLNTLFLYTGPCYTSDNLN